MAAEVLSIVNQANLDKIESFVNDPTYQELLESSVNYNTRLCIERRLRLPFLDSQTGVAQNHSNLFMSKRQRMPGSIPGQIYTYPRQRWRKRRRQYLMMNARSYARAMDHHHMMEDGDLHSISQMENPAMLQDTDSKDSQLNNDMSKDWYYDDPDMLEMDPYDEPDQDSDLDYEESYRKKPKGRRGAGRGRGGLDSPGTPGRKKGPGRGRKKASTPAAMSHFEPPSINDPDKPFACELCGARYKTRPGLMYHYSHSHKDATPPPVPSASSMAAAAAAAAAASTSAAASSAGSDGDSRDTPEMMMMTSTPPNVGQHLAQMSQMTNQIYQGPPVSPYHHHHHAPPPPWANYPHQMPPQHPLQPQLPPHTGDPYQNTFVDFVNHPAAGTPGRRGRPSSQPPPPSASPAMPPSTAPPNLPPNLSPAPPPPAPDDAPMPVLTAENPAAPAPSSPTPMIPSTVPQVAAPSTSAPSPSSGPPQQQLHPHAAPIQPGHLLDQQKAKASPNPYCDFCLGDSTENKKTGTQEELVSCSDCGRSGKGAPAAESVKVAVKKGRKKKAAA